MPEFEINYLAVLVSAVAGFVIVMLNKVLWEGKPFKLYLLDAAHYLVVLLAMGSILVVLV